jgi:hypothetical protein
LEQKIIYKKKTKLQVIKNHETTNILEQNGIGNESVKLEVLQIEFANLIHNCNTSCKGDKFDTKSTPNSNDEDKICK